MLFLLLFPRHVFTGTLHMYLFRTISRANWILVYISLVILFSTHLAIYRVFTFLPLHSGQKSHKHRTSLFKTIPIQVFVHFAISFSTCIWPRVIFWEAKHRIFHTNFIPPSPRRSKLSTCYSTFDFSQCDNVTFSENICKRNVQRKM